MASRVMSNNIFLNSVKLAVGEEYTFLEPYSGTHTKISVRHNICGNTYTVAPNKFVSGGRRCPECSKEKVRLANIKTPAEYAKEIADSTDNDYTVMSDYISFNEYIQIKHNTCGRIYKVKPHKFKSGDRCKHCSMQKVGLTKVLPQEEWVKRFESVSKGEYTCLDNYTLHDVPLKVRHNKCNHIYSVTPHNFYVNRSRCPNCYRKIPRISNKSLFISLILDALEEDYDTEMCFEGCKNKRNLPFDFYLPTKDLLIEFDGEQHFKTSDRHTQSALDQVIFNDNIKNKFALKTNTPLLRMNYRMSFDEIESTLKQFLQFNDQSKDVLYKQSMIEEMGGILIYKSR